MVPIVKGYMVPSERSQAKGHGENARPRLVSHRRWLSMVAAEYGSPPEIAGHAGAGVGLYDPRSARGRPLTAAAGARNRV
jgi:hypothetical protein